MKTQDYGIINRLCNKNEVCSFCHNTLEIIKDCIVMNECGHMMHECCFRKLSDNQQYSCYSCQGKISMTFVVIRDGENIEMRRQSEFEQKIIYFFLQQLSKLQELNQLNTQKDNQIIQLNDQIGILQKNLEDLLLYKENQQLQQRKSDSNIFNSSDIFSFDNRRKLQTNKNINEIHQYKEDQQDISTIIDFDQNQESRKNSQYTDINDKLFDSNIQSKIKGKSQYILKCVNGQEKNNNSQNCLKQNNVSQFLQENQDIQRKNFAEYQISKDKNEIELLNIKDHNNQFQNNSNNSNYNAQKKINEKLETHSKQKEIKIDSFKFSFGTKKDINIIPETENNISENNLEKKYSGNDTNTIIFTQEQINDLLNLSYYISQNNQITADISTLTSKDSELKANDNGITFNDSQTTKNNQSSSIDSQITNKDNQITNNDNQLANNDCQVNINNKDITFQNKKVINDDINNTIKKQKESVFYDSQNPQINKPQRDSCSPHPNQNNIKDQIQIDLKSQDLNNQHQLYSKIEQRIQINQFHIEISQKQQQNNKNDDRNLKNSPNKIVQNCSSKNISPKSIKKTYNSNAKEFNRSKSQDKNKYPYHPYSFSQRKDKSPKETKMRLIVDNCIQSFSKIKQKLNFTNFLTQKNNQPTNENVNTINLPHLNQHLSNLMNNNNNKINSKQQINCKEIQSEKKVTFNKLARRSKPDLNIHHNQNILTYMPKYIQKI